MASQCACGQPTDTMLCRRCLGRLCDDLTAVPELWVELETTLARLDKLGDGSASRNAETALPYKPHAAEMRWVLRNVLVGWVRDLADRHGLPLPSDDVPALANWLLQQRGAIANHPAADEIADEIGDAVRQARRAIDLPSDTRMYLGLCDAPHESSCGEELYARPGSDTTTCRRCGAGWDVDDRRTWMLGQVEHEVATAPVLSGLLTRLGVALTPKDIHGMAKAGTVRWVDMDSSRRRKYRVGDVLDAFLATAEEAS